MPPLLHPNKAPEPAKRGKMKAIEDAAVLREVWFIPEEIQGPEDWCFAQVAFLFDGSALVFTPIADTDEVRMAEVEARDFRVTPKMRQPAGLFAASFAGVFAEAMGERLSDLWRCRNSRGYDDLVVLSFGPLVPSVALLAMCSSLNVYRFQPALRGRASGFPVD